MRKTSRFFAALALALLCVLGCGVFIACEKADDGDKPAAPVQYTVKLLVGDSEYSLQHINSGEKATCPVPPAVEESPEYTYSFDGWFEESSDMPFDFSTPITSDLVLFGRFSSAVKKYTVLFTDGADEYYSYRAAYGSVVELPAPPKKQSTAAVEYTFAGWCTDSALTKPFDANTGVQSDLHLYAKYSETARTYAVRYISGGEVFKSLDYEYGDIILQPDERPQMADTADTVYDFNGWYADEELSEPFTFGVKVKGNTTLYASFTSSARTFTVRFLVDGEDVISPSELVYGASVTRPNDPKKQNAGNVYYSFEYWSEEGSGEPFDFSSTISGELTLVARFSQKDASTVAGYNSLLEEMFLPGHLYVHYKRIDHDEGEEGAVNAGAPEYLSAIASDVYSDRGIWVWPKNSEGRLFMPMKIDISGAVYDILLDHDYNDGGWDNNTKHSLDLPVNYKTSGGSPVTEIGFMLISVASRLSGGFWQNDGGDTYITLSDAYYANGSYHWFVSEGKVPYGGKTLLNKEADDPYTDIPAGSAVSIGNINSNRDNSAQYPFAASTVEPTGVVYDIIISSFCDSNGDGIGDISGITSKLDYIKSLNADYICISPFVRSKSVCDYGVVDIGMVDPLYGTENDLRELVYKAHQKGIKVMSDIIVNCVATSNEWFIKSQNLVKEEVNGAEIDYRNFFIWINEDQYNSLGSRKNDWYRDNYGYYYYSAFYSSEYPLLNFDYQPVRDAIIKACTHWLELGLDGFIFEDIETVYPLESTRFATLGGQTSKAVGNLQWYDWTAYDVTRTLNLFRELNYKIKSAHPDALLMGHNNYAYKPYMTYENLAAFACGLDDQYDLLLRESMAEGFAKAAGGQTDALSSALNVYVQGREQFSQVAPSHYPCILTGEISKTRLRDELIAVHAYGEKAYIGFTADDSYPAGDTESLVSASDALVRLYFAMQMTLPGLAVIYYGDELGMTGNFDAWNDGAYAVRTTYQPMKWSDDLSKNASYSIGYQDKKVELVGLNATSYVRGAEHQTTDESSIYSWVKTLTALRASRPELVRGTVYEEAGGDGLLVYRLEYNGSAVRVYINTGAPAPISGEALVSYNCGDGVVGTMGVAICTA